MSAGTNLRPCTPKNVPGTAARLKSREDRMSTRFSLRYPIEPEIEAKKTVQRFY